MIGQTALKQLLQQLQPGTATNQVQESQLHSYQQNDIVTKSDEIAEVDAQEPIIPIIQSLAGIRFAISAS